MKYCFLILLIIEVFTPGMAQSSSIPRDTSYTIHSTYLKLKKDYPGIEPVWPSLPKRVKAKLDLPYYNFDDRQLHLDVFYPKGKRKKLYPGILMIHGGGWTSGTKDNVIPMAQQLATAGYVTVTVEYRLSPEAAYPAGVYDLKAAIVWMRTHGLKYGIDGNKIAVLGCSAGAHLASLLGTTGDTTLYQHNYNPVSSSVQAVLNIDGIVSFVHPEAEPEWTGKSANRWLGVYEENYETWKEASPLEYADTKTPPFLFVNSAYPRFHAGRDDLVKILERHNIYYEVHTLEGAPHAFWLLRPWFDPTRAYILNFLEKVF